MSPASVMLRLPPRRLDQLKTLSAVLNLSLADTIGHMLRKEIAAGVIPGTIPGIVVERAGDTVSITFDDHPALVFSLDIARLFASTIRDVVAGVSGPYTIQAGAWFSIQRIGNGFKINLRMGGPDVVLSGDLARDLADLIEKAAT
ncbi:MAG: hypothetical protein J0I42_00910 [Bosea sp.]|uniref:hypothetical protein n=1 Tax=Bosea sp. (in: a-proteobacteria) TaxID=1871050 RepID=UPI001ACC8282|nr:hypothetical protein [Bosea sp. (in: a-proteobacteria)]MBN9450483.1 hypothetical protein [Bosea sp. (in: a-proteobacteria)]